MDGNPYLGSIGMFGGNFAVRGWAFCDGQLLPISQYSALFSILGTIYGGDGRTTFALPDLRGRVAIHEGNGPGLSDRRLGAKGGQETVTLTTSEIPAHHHYQSIQVGKEGKGSGATDTAAGSYLGNATDLMYRTVEGTAGQTVNGGNSNNTGGGQDHNNMQPWLAINYEIALQGVFPSRS